MSQFYLIFGFICSKKIIDKMINTIEIHIYSYKILSLNSNKIVQLIILILLVGHKLYVLTKISFKVNNS
jgi:hypothetical protein